MTPVITPSLRQARRLVIKIGSALLVDEAAGAIQHARLAGLAEDVVQLRRAGAEVMIVTGSRTALEYFLEPLTRTIQRSMREG